VGAGQELSTAFRGKWATVMREGFFLGEKKVGTDGADGEFPWLNKKPDLRIKRSSLLIKKVSRTAGILHSFRKSVKGKK